MGMCIEKNKKAKFKAVARAVVRASQHGRPILIGTRTIADSVSVSEVLTALALEHEVLNAMQNEEEADIILRAGQMGRVTVATNMAGRGTDIKVGSKVKELGGLHVIITELHEASRIDRQLYGRSGRQGDPGSYEYIMSLDDEIIDRYLPVMMKKIMQSSWVIVPALGRLIFYRPLFNWAQQRAEKHNSVLRNMLIKSDEKRLGLTAFSGKSL